MPNLYVQHYEKNSTFGTSAVLVFSKGIIIQSIFFVANAHFSDALRLENPAHRSCLLWQHVSFPS
jgi:hypothetical protein